MGRQRGGVTLLPALKDGTELLKGMALRAKPHNRTTTRQNLSVRSISSFLQWQPKLSVSNDPLFLSLCLSLSHPPSLSPCPSVSLSLCTAKAHLPKDIRRPIQTSRALPVPVVPSAPPQ